MRDLIGKAHDLFSERLYMPFSRLQRIIRPSHRLMMMAVNAGMRFRKEAAGWSDDEKQEWSLNRLRFALRRAYRETSFYRDRFRQIGFDPWMDFSFDDFSRLPVLDREEVQQAGKTMVSTAMPANELRKDSTGGSTGTPTEIWTGPEERGWREGAREYFMERIGAGTGTRTGMLWGHHLDPVRSESLRDRVYSFVTNVRWFDCFRLSPDVLEKYHREFERYSPACILAYASALGQLAEHLLEHGYNPAYPTRCFITGAEKLLPHHREAVELAFGKSVHERYGGRDVGCMGFQTSPAETLDYTVDWGNIFIEPETDEPDSPILITKLHADAMPMIRYRVGDIGRFPAISKPGHPTFVLHEVLGRATDRIWLPNAGWITGLQFPHMLKDYPVREFMFIQRPDYSVELKIVPRQGFGQESRRQILATVADNLPGLDLSIELVEEIPRTRANKRRPVISEVNPIRRKLAS